MKAKNMLILGLVFLFAACMNQEVTETVHITPNAIFMTVGDVQTLQVSTGNALWSSSDETVATVSGGIVEALKDGHTVITAQKGEATGTADVYVTQIGGTYLGEYELVWSDEFDGDALDQTNWTIENGGGGWGNQEKQFYTSRPENIRVQNGCLEIEARKESYQNHEYTSARIKSENKKEFAYGKMEARIMMPDGRGTWPAFWMKGKGSWPKKGEIDIMEHVGSQPKMISHAVHTNNKNGMRGGNWGARYYGEQSMENEWHTYGIEWEHLYTYGKDAIKFFVDGKQTAIVVADKAEEDIDSWPFFDPEFFIINMAIGGTLGGSIDVDIFNDPTNSPVIMYVDWVHVYQKVMK